MIAPVVVVRPKTPRTDSVSIKNGAGAQTTPKRFALAVAIGKVLHDGDDNPDNSQKLKKINSLVENASSDELKQLVNDLPDNALTQWIKEIQKNATPNSGLNADQRQSFFSLLAKELTPAQATRWQSVMPDSIKDEFVGAVEKFKAPDQFKSANQSESDAWQYSLFSIGNAATEPGQQATRSAGKQQLIDAHAKLSAEIATMTNGGGNRQALTTAIREANTLFRQHGLGDLVPYREGGHLNFIYDSKTLPTELYVQFKNDKGMHDSEFGDKNWYVNVDIEI